MRWLRLGYDSIDSMLRIRRVVPLAAAYLRGDTQTDTVLLRPDFSFRPEEITIAQLLKTKGYVCGHFGKWHVGTGKE